MPDWSSLGRLAILISLWLRNTSAWSLPARYDDCRRHSRTTTVSWLLAHEDHAPFLPDNHVDWEEVARNTAAQTLESVLCTPNNNSNMTAEKALQRTLRRSSFLSTGGGAVSADNTRRWLRRRIKELVLGTSIFRLRHEYVWNQSNTMTSIPNSTNKSYRIRDLVDLHASYYSMLQNNETNNDDDSIVLWPSNVVERMSVQHSLPRFLVQLWMDQYGHQETNAICRACNQPGPITLRRNRIVCASDEELIVRLNEEGFVLEPLQDVYLKTDAAAENDGSGTRWVPPEACLRVIYLPRNKSIWSISTWRDGCFEVQDVGSQLIVAAAEIKAGDTVVDYCAGNGGKTLALASNLYASKAPPTGQVIAHDIVPERLAQLRGSLKRAGLMDCDSVRISTTAANAELDLNDVEMADAVLVDAPCSSCGVLRRRPSQRWLITENDVRIAFPELQLSILKNAARLVKPGGRLVYATCSIAEWENQHVVKALEASVEHLGFEKWDFDDNYWPSQDSFASHCRQLLPHVHDSDGFFIARWKRTT